MSPSAQALAALIAEEVSAEEDVGAAVSAIATSLEEVTPVLDGKRHISASADEGFARGPSPDIRLCRGDLPLSSGSTS